MNDERKLALTSKENGKIYIGLGSLGNNWYMIDTNQSEKKWTKIAQWPTVPREQATATIIDGKIYVFGGIGKDKSGVGRRLATGEHKIEKRKPSSEFSRRNNYWYIAPQKGEHPAVFPEQLANDHIISWSNENDIVLDPFMGSGTTAKMALLANRNFIGFEIDEEYTIIKEDYND